MSDLTKSTSNNEDLEKFAETVMGYKTGELVSLMIYLGDRNYSPLKKGARGLFLAYSRGHSFV